MNAHENRVSSVLPEMCKAVAVATIMRPMDNGGRTISSQVGEHLADKLAFELAEMLASVMPAAVVGTIEADLLEGAEEIAKFIFGSADDRRKVYHLAQTSRIPVFRMGAVVCARKSTLLRWIADQEAKATVASQ